MKLSFGDSVIISKGTQQQVGAIERREKRSILRWESIQRRSNLSVRNRHETDKSSHEVALSS